MAKQELKVGDLVKWGIPSKEKEIQHAMVVEFHDSYGDGIPPYWIAMRGDGSRWSICRATQTGKTSTRGTWFNVSKLRGDRWDRVTVSGVLVR
jgi:hypothetical protein